MTARRATVRLYVAVVQLATLGVSLAGALVRLALGLVKRGIRCVETPKGTAQAARPPVRSIPAASPVSAAAEGLCRMGFRRSDVGAWAAKRTAADAGKSVGDLVKEGLRDLTN